MSSLCLRLSLVAALLWSVPAEARDIRVCADPNNMPFSNRAGQGFENRIMELVARDLGATLSYEWRPQRRGFLRNTLKAFRCDVVPGVPANLEGIATTAPYYRSGYAFVTRPGDPPVTSLDDQSLKTRIIGVQLIGDDGYNAPPAHALARRGLTANIRGFPVYGDYADDDPAAGIVRSVARHDIDVAAVWGPVAGYFAMHQNPPLTVELVTPSFDGPQLPMVFDIAMGVRRNETAFRDELDRALEHRSKEIAAILRSFGVPLITSAAP